MNKSHGKGIKKITSYDSAGDKRLTLFLLCRKVSL